MTSSSGSSLGSTRIILEFNFDRDIGNGAARDVQAAINAAQSLLPGWNARSRPTYRKANPSDADYDFNAHLGELVTGQTV